jgi:hypothetical protein
LYNRQELAIIALVGALLRLYGEQWRWKLQGIILVPGYLNGGLLVIAYNRAWRLLNLLAFRLPLYDGSLDV